MRLQLAIVSLPLCVFALGGPEAGRGQQGQVPRFRTSVTAVAIDVYVARRGRPLPGLVADDFLVTDDGVPQKVHAVSMVDVPIDVTVVHDRSGSQAGRLSKLEEAIGRVADGLDSGDRLRMVRFGEEGRIDVGEWRRGGELVEPMAPGTRLGSAVYDALVHALVHRSSGERRHLVVALTDGVDTGSAAAVDGLRAVAERSAAVVDLVLFDGANEPSSPRPWSPTGIDPTGRGELKAIARMTGGEVRDPWLGNPDPVEAIEESIASFRSSYLVSFTPEEPVRPGWHELRVTVPSHGRVTIRTRAGYLAGM